MLEVNGSYEGKNIALLGCKNTVGKVLLRQILVATQLGHKINKLFILDEKLESKKKPIDKKDYFMDEHLFRSLNWQLINSKVELFFIPQDPTSMQKIIPHVDILFNCLLPQDYTRCGIFKCLNSHIWKVKQICHFLNHQCASIDTLVTVSSLYCQNPGYISQGDVQKNKQNQFLQFSPSQSISAQKLQETVYDVFSSEHQIWQWSIQYMEFLYSQMLSSLIKFTHQIVRLPQIGPTFNGYEGYMANFNSIMNLLYEVGNGFLDHLEGAQGNIIDMIPTDYVANYLIVIAVMKLPTQVIGLNDDINQLSKSKAQTLDLRFSNSQQNKQRQINHQICLHNLSTSSRNPINISTFSQYIIQAWRQYSKSMDKRISLSIQQKKWQKKAYFFKNNVPKNIKQRLAVFLDIKPWIIQSQQDKVSQNKKREIVKKYKFYLTHQWICESNKSIDYYFALSHQDQQKFHFNVNSINWKTYAKLCCYSIKKFLLGMEVQQFNPLSLDLLTMQKSVYFSDIMWALSQGRNIETQNCQEIKKYILSTKSVKEVIKDLVEEQTGKLQQTPMAYQKVEEQFYKIADQMCEQMFSQYSMRSIRVFAWFLHKVFRTIYEKVVIDKNSITKLKNHNERQNGPIIIIPTHRSYIDFLIMSYVFFGYGVKCPHIAAAEDFLNMAVVHILLRKSGAFFIKRNVKKNRLLYKVIMTQYISKLLGENHYLEFFIEGTRSRVGKMLSPKYGILSIVAKNVLDGKIPDSQILPITINYQKILEGQSFTYEMMGQSKVKESLQRLLKAADILKQNYGRIYVELCDMISVKDYFSTVFPKGFDKKPDDKEISVKFEKSLEKMGYIIVHKMTKKLIIMPPAIVASVLLMNRIGISDDRLAQKVKWLCQQINSRGIKVARTQADSSISLSSTLHLLEDIVNKSRKDMFEVQVSFDQNSFKQLFTLTYYRNTLTHIFFEQSLIAVALGTFGHQALITGTIKISQLSQIVLYLGNLLKRQFVLEKYVDQQGRIQEVLNFMAEKGVVNIVQNQKIWVPNPQSNLFTFYCSLVWPVVESYWIFCLYLFKLQKDSLIVPVEKLQSEIQWFGQSLFTERIILHLEAISMDTIKNATSYFIGIGVLKEKSQIGKNGLKVVIPEQNLKKIQSQISSFLKNKYAASLKGIIGVDRSSSSVNLDFPFLAKL